MFETLKSLFAHPAQGKKILEDIGPAEPNFKIVANHVRAGKSPKNYVLEDAGKLPTIIEKWAFEPGEVVGRCGYDYQIIITNGERTIPISVCFLCNTLVFNHLENYKVSKKQMMNLLIEDFKLI